MIKSNAETNAIVFQREHPVPADVRKDCPEFAEALDAMIAKAVEDVRHGEEPYMADLQLRLKVVAWVVDYKSKQVVQAATPASREPVYAV